MNEETNYIIVCIVDLVTQRKIEKAVKDRKELVSFKKDFFEMMTESRYYFFKGIFPFSGKEYPDIECVIQHNSFDLSTATGILFENVCKRIMKQYLNYFKEIKERYMFEQNERNYKIIGELVVPIILEEMRKV